MLTSKLPIQGASRDKLDQPFNHWLARQTHGISPVSLQLAYADWLHHLLLSPSRQIELGASALAHWLLYAAQGWHDDGAAPADPALRDRRFAHSDWKKPPFNALAQAFLLQQQWWAEASTGVRGVSRHHEEMVAFTARQWLDMWSPSNFIATNPQVQHKTLATAGTNLLNGLAHWWHDALAVLGDGKARGVEKFIPGETVATTAGELVFRNALIELIHYRPVTPQVDVEPVLIVPSWIMKYHILDLTTRDSLADYLVGQGHAVLMVSWKNPSSEDCNLGLNDYLELGVMPALQAMQRMQPQARVHAMGYCLGGTLLAIAAAALADDGPRLLKTLTLLAAQTDFHAPGELPDDPQEWFDRTPLRSGSWWPFWDQWLHAHSSGTMAPAEVRAAGRAWPVHAPALKVARRRCSAAGEVRRPAGTPTVITEHCASTFDACILCRIPACCALVLLPPPNRLTIHGK